MRFLQVGEHQVEYFDVEGQKLRPIEASRAEAVLGHQAYKTEILWVSPVHLVGFLWASLEPPNYRQHWPTTYITN